MEERRTMSEVCEWFEQWLDNRTNEIVFRFSDGTTKRAKFGDYIRDYGDGIAYKMGYAKGLEEGVKE